MKILFASIEVAPEEFAATHQGVAFVLVYAGEG
jgi:hypothetical protein